MISRSLAANCGSLDSLNCRIRCGCSPWLRQMRWMELTLMPLALAMAGAVQWVVSPGGSVRVRATTCSPFSRGSDGIRGGRVLSRNSPSTPSCMKRSCQRQTAVLATPAWRMISAVPTPSALSSTIFARQTCFCGLLRSVLIASSRSRSLAMSSKLIPVRMRSIRIPRRAGGILFGLFRQVLSTSFNDTGPTRATMPNALSDSERELMDAYWRAANYLSVGQIYLYDNPLLKEPLTKDHIKPRLLGHWGTTPGLNFIYVHLNRMIKKHDLNMIYITGPGHGGPGLVANAYLEGTYSEVYPNISSDEEGIKRLFTQFSFPGGIPSHVAPETPGSIHEGGELGYAISHAYGAAFDNPDLIVACVVGDGEAETGALATSWHSNKFLNPATDGAVLPILHLNGYKIANPTVLARITPEELEHLFRGYGYTPYFVEGDEPEKMHELMATTLDTVIGEIQRIQSDARRDGFTKRPRWPMIVLRTPKGWTCPKQIDGKRTEDYWRSHQVPMGEMHENAAHVRILEQWMKSYQPGELFDSTGRLRPELAELAPHGTRRMSANPHTNGGLLLRELRLPNFRDYAVQVTTPGAITAESTRIMGGFLRDVMKANMGSRNFRLFSPDESNSNRWQDVLEVTNRAWVAETEPWDDHLAPDGRVMEMLSEQQCQGWLEGYLLTGRHGFFSCYEAFIHIIDSMFNQHAKWLKVCNHIPWRRPIASLNYLLSSHVWRQDNNGFSHQDPGFIDHVVNKKASVIRVYLPPDANCLLSTMDHCLRSRHYVNVVVA